MLKQLFSRIKSEKSKSSSITQTFQKQNNQQHQDTKFLIDYLLPQLSLVPTIPTIKYAVLNDFPDLTASILGCGIKFHDLPYSNRRVKQISTSEHQKLPQYASYMLKVFQEHLKEPNHFLINDYPSGVGIMSHFDGPAYYPKVVVYSIGTVIIRFTKQEGEQIKLLLQDKSLHVFQNEAYTEYMHGILDHGEDCVFFKVEKGEVTNASVVNFKQTKIYQDLSQLGFDCLPAEKMIGQFQISSVSDNHQYNKKLTILRKRRISVTIRHKYF